MHKQPAVTAATRKKLMDAFWNEYQTKPIEKITISSITKSAGVHRSTFYEYFRDIYDLLEQFEEDFLTHLKNELIPLVQKNLSEAANCSYPELKTFINTTLSFFTKYGDFLYHLSGSSGDPGFRKKLYKLFKSTFLTAHKIPADSPYADFLASFVFAVILNNLEYWYEHKNILTMEEVIVLTYKLMGERLSRNDFL